jgi:hypothetical protein
VKHPLSGLFSARRRLRQQAREIRSLRRQVAELRRQNDSMRAGMRRCLSCSYRLACRDGEASPTILRVPRE